MSEIVMRLFLAVLILGAAFASAKDYSVTAGDWQIDFKSNETLYTDVEWTEPATPNSDDYGYYTVWAKKDPGTTPRSSALFLYNPTSPVPINRAWLGEYTEGLFSPFNNTPSMTDYLINGQKAIIAEAWDTKSEKFVYGATYPIGPTSDNTAQLFVEFLSFLDKKTTFEILDSLHVEYNKNVKQSSQQPQDNAPPIESTKAGIITSTPGTREDPVPIGTSVNLGDGWVVTVLSVTPDATSIILQENQFNDRPASGNQFFLARVRADYEGDGSDTFDGSYRLRAVGPSGVGYSTFENSAGVIPDELPGSEVFTGGSIEGNIAWQIKSSDAGSLVMYDSKASKTGRLYMALFGGATTQPSSPSSDRAWEYQGTGKMGRY